MSDRHAVYRIDRAYRVFVTEFLRAIAAHDPTGRAVKVNAALVELIGALVDAPKESRIEALNTAVSDILDDARALPSINNLRVDALRIEADRAEARIAISAAKVLAEKISGVMAQLSDAESAMHEAIREHDRALAELRSKRVW